MSETDRAGSKPPSSAQTLRRLFLTLFLRGRGARGLSRRTAPGSILRKLLMTLIFYALFGMIALALVGQPVLSLSVYMHAMTFIFVSMFVASSAGEMLFNKEEGDILLHRPIEPRALLWAKIAVLVQVSLWLAGAFNLAGLVVGAIGLHAWLFPLAHIVSTALEALFCAGLVVLTYQLCLRWFGREQLERLMTTAQVLVSIGFIVSAQIVPRVLVRFGTSLEIDFDSWWFAFLPPAWFAAFDDALAGSHAAFARGLGAVAVLATALVLRAAFGKLAQDYVTGLQHLGESGAPRKARTSGARWAARWANLPPLRWWLRDPGARSGFVLTAAYMARDRDVKLRLYPGIVPFLILPVIMFLQGRGDATFSVAVSGSFIAMVPMLALRILRFSQQWQASDLFRMVPIKGPASLCDGARSAVLCFLGLPVLAAFASVSWLVVDDTAKLALLVPGLVAAPLYALIASSGSDALPFSLPSEEARSANRGVWVFGMMIGSFALAGLTTLATLGGWFRWFVAGEIGAVAVAYWAVRAGTRAVAWSSIE